MRREPHAGAPREPRNCRNCPRASGSRRARGRRNGPGGHVTAPTAAAPPTAAPGRGFAGAANGRERRAGQGARVSGEPRALGRAARSWLAVRWTVVAVTVTPATPCALGLYGRRVVTSRWQDTPVTSPRERWRLAFPLSSLAALPAGALERGLGELGSKKLNRAHKLPSRLTFKGTTAREMCETRTRSVLVPAGLGWVWGVPVSRARLLLGFRSGHPSAGTSEQSQGRQGTPRGCCRPGEAASAREPSCERGRRCPSAAGRPDSETHSKPGPQPSRPPGRAEASGLSVPPAPAALGSRPRAVGEGGWVVAEEEEGSGGGDQPAPARPSPARCPGRTRRPGRRWRTSRRRSRTCRPWWDTRTGSPSPPRWPAPAPRAGEEEAEARPPPPRNSWSRTSEVGTGQAGPSVLAGALGPIFVYCGPGRSPPPARGRAPPLSPAPPPYRGEGRLPRGW